MDNIFSYYLNRINDKKRYKFTLTLLNANNIPLTSDNKVTVKGPLFWRNFQIETVDDVLTFRGFLGAYRVAAGDCCDTFEVTIAKENEVKVNVALDKNRKV